MKHVLFALASMGIIAGIVRADDTPPPAEALSAMLGEWEGEGWRLSPQGERQTYSIHESLVARAGGHAIQIVGTGHAGEGDATRIVHEAFAMIWQERDGSYRMRSVVAPGYSMQTEPELTGTGYVWTLQAGPATIRYETRIEDDVWFETGDRLLPGGNSARVLEMRLERVE